jgi:hypothetical protein
MATDGRVKFIHTSGEADRFKAWIMCKSLSPNDYATLSLMAEQDIWELDAEVQDMLVSEGVLIWNRGREV